MHIIQTCWQLECYIFGRKGLYEQHFKVFLSEKQSFQRLFPFVCILLMTTNYKGCLLIEMWAICMEFKNRVYLWILESDTVQEKHHFSMWPVKYLAQELCYDLDGVYLVPFAIYSAFEVCNAFKWNQPCVWLYKFLHSKALNALDIVHTTLHSDPWLPSN